MMRRHARVYDPITCSSERFDDQAYGWPVAVRNTQSANARSTGTARGKRVERSEPANTQNPSQYWLSFIARLTCALAAYRSGGVAPAGWAEARKIDSTSMNPIRKKPVSAVNRPSLQRAKRTRKRMSRRAGPPSTQTPWATVRNCPRRCSYRTRGRSEWPCRADDRGPTGRATHSGGSDFAGPGSGPNAGPPPTALPGW